MSASMIAPRECRTCASVCYGLRSQAWCHREGQINAFEVALEHACDLWTERPDPFAPREDDDE